MKTNFNKYQSVIIVNLIILFIYLKHLNLKYLITLVFFNLLLSLLISRYADLIHFLWNKIVLLTSKIFPTIILSTIFYLVVLPMALIKKILNFNTEDSFESYYTIRDKKFNPEDFINPW